MLGVMLGVWSVLKHAWAKDYSKKRYRKIIEKFFGCVNI
jgi:hypothetical protein